ncbi:MAG: ribosome maturation factor RimM, partial [Neisseriaceae bacterium]|nr:ribosome maturation factor RimM [Neisseriaceae bacterium]
PRVEFLPTEQDEYYLVDLVGLKVINHHKEIIGEVMGLMETGANDVLVVSAKSERKKTLIPFVDVYIQSVDIEKGVMTVDWELDY